MSLALMAQRMASAVLPNLMYKSLATLISAMLSGSGMNGTQLTVSKHINENLMLIKLQMLVIFDI
jgi:hypothetical protein